MLTTFSGRKASQDELELRCFIEFLCQREASRYLEIGAREGDTFHEVCIQLDAHHGLNFALAVDLPGGLWGKSSTAAKLAQCVDALRLEDMYVESLIGSSRDEYVIKGVVAHGPYDAVLIDGDHTYEGVKADWETYRSLAPIVAFHDIVGEGQFEKVTRRGVEVPRLWAEIKASGLKTVEFVSPGSAMGIGVVIQA